MGGDVGVGDDARQVLGILVERDALGVGFLWQGGVVGTEEDELGGVNGSEDGGYCGGEAVRDGAGCVVSPASNIINMTHQISQLGPASLKLWEDFVQDTQSLRGIVSREATIDNIVAPRAVW